MSGKVGAEAQNFPEAAILDVVEVEKAFLRLIFFPLDVFEVERAFPRLMFFLCRAAQTLLALRGVSALWVLSFEERLWCPSCILEEPNPNFGT